MIYFYLLSFLGFIMYQIDVIGLTQVILYLPSSQISDLIDKYLQNYSLVPAVVSTVPLPLWLIRLNIPEKFQSFHLSWPAFSLQSVLLTCLGLNSQHRTNQSEANPASQSDCWELRQAVKLSLTALLALALALALA